MNHKFFAACSPGADSPLFEEMKGRGFGGLRPQGGGVAFSGPISEGYRAVMELRVAVRVFLELGRIGADDADTLYREAKALPWENFLAPSNTFAVDAKVMASETLTHSGFAALKLKDAIADSLRARFGSRPDVDTADPDARIFLLVNGKRAVVSLDLAGKPLGKRGYRAEAVKAPISECLAATAIRFSGWDEKSPLLDPFCGSGTILIEGAMKAAGIMPGSLHQNYSFERLPGFDRSAWENIVKKAGEGVCLPKKLIIIGSDIDPDAVQMAQRNALRAGVGDIVRFEVGDAAGFSPKKGWGATVISNPPFGERLSDEESLVPLFNAFGRALVSKCSGYAIHLFLTSQRLRKALMLKPEKYWPLPHGGLDARLYRFLVK